MTSSMEVDASASDVMASTGTSGSVSVSLHPLVIMNVSEHFTRVRAQEGKPMQVFGALIGKQKGRNIEVMNSFELLFSEVDGDIIIDMEYYGSKELQLARFHFVDITSPFTKLHIIKLATPPYTFKQVFSEMDFLGWYTTGDTPSESDIKVHRQICLINESPIFLKLNSQAKHADTLPLSLYETVIDLVNGEATMLFVELTYTLATEEAERIGVDHVARVSTTDTGESSAAAQHLQAQHSSVKMLHSRVKLILEYIKGVEAGELPKNADLLREAYSLCYRLPVLNTNKFKEDFYNQCNDVSLMAYLGTLTKGCDTINQFVNKFNVLYGREGMGRRTRGLFF